MSDKENIVVRIKEHIDKTAEERIFLPAFTFESYITMPIYAKRIPITEEGIHKVLKWVQESPVESTPEQQEFLDYMNKDVLLQDENGNRVDILMDAMSTIAPMDLASLWDREMYALICDINNELAAGPLGDLVWVHSFTWDGNFDITFKYVDAGTFRARNRLKNYRSYFESVKYKHAMAWMRKFKGE